MVENTHQQSAALIAALRYRARGWSVLPFRAGEKRPQIAWERYQSAPAPEATIRSWFRRWPNANVGVVTGQVSNLIVIDIDPRHGGEQSLHRLEARYGHLPATIEARTGGGGRHLYFAHPGELVHNRAGLAPGIDLRGDGGCIVAPPSLHPSGGRYQWVDGHAPDEIDLAPLPRWLLALAHGVRAGRTLVDWRMLVRTGVPEGQRNSTIASLAGHLLWHGVDAEVVQELLLAWNRMRCRPPLDDAEVAQVVSSIVHLHEAGDVPEHDAALIKAQQREASSR